MAIIELTAAEIAELRFNVVRGIRKYTTSDGRTVEVDVATAYKVLSDAPVVIDEEEAETAISGGRSTLAAFHRNGSSRSTGYIDPDA